MMLKRKYVLLTALLATVVAVVLYVRRPTAFDVETAVVERSPMQVTIDENGVTRVRHHVEIAAPINGRLAESHLQVGDSVRAGAVVAEMSPAPLDPRLREQFEASSRAASSLRKEASERIDQAEIALAEARRRRARSEQLRQTNTISQQDLELAIDAERLRERDLSAARAKEEAAIEEERRARFALISANPTEQGGARVPLRAPIAGRVLRLFEEHDRVVAAGTPLVEVGDLHSLEVVVDVLTRDAAQITPGMPLVVATPGQSEMRARVTRVEPSAFTKVSPLGVEEQRVNVIGQFLEPVRALGDNFEVDASIVVWRGENVVHFPTSALVPIGSGWGAFVARRGRAELRKIEIGRRAVRDIEVKSGVNPGDSVVVRPDDRLRSGDRVRPVSSPWKG